MGHRWIWDSIHGLSAERVDLLDIEALRYVFVVAPQILAAELQQHVVAAARSVTLLQQSRNITIYAMTAGRVHNHSLSSTQVAQLVGHAIPHHQLRDIDTVNTELLTQIDGERVLMFRPLLMRPEPGRDTALPEPPPRPTPPPPAQAKAALQQSAARRALDDRLANEYARLLARHEDERKRAAQQEESQEALRQQHERERRAFDIYAEQERQVLDNRLKRKRGKVQFRLYYDEPTDHTNLRREIGGASR